MARAVPRLATVVVLPTPPFPDVITIVVPGISATLLQKVVRNL
jgi:hypothetical protein